ncbi:MAG: hypothetical protein ACJ77M_10040 [Thermoleophilaceae bacterium]
MAVPSAHAATGMEVALQDDGVFSSQAYYSRERAFKQAQQLGVTRLRVNVAWTSVASSVKSRRKPRHVFYAFNQYDSLFVAAKAHNIKLQLTLTGPAPAWATGNHRIGPYKPNAKYYAEFVRATVAHFRGLVDRYSIWNEPNYVGWLAPLSQGPSLYRKLYVAGYAAAKKADPSAQVLIAETSPYALTRRATAPLDFLRGVTCTNRSFSHPSCGALKADGYAHHPYDFDHPPSYRYPGSANATLSTLSRLTTALDRLAQAHALSTPTGAPLDLYLTEYGFMEHGKHHISASRHASWLRQGFQMALRNSRVKEMLQYLLVAPTSRYAFFDTSIASRRGKATSAFKTLAAWTKAAAKAGRIAIANQQQAAAPAPGATAPSAGGSAGGTAPPA